MIISFIVCRNGYGHLKRVVSVVNELLSRNADLSIRVFICPQQQKALAYFTNSSQQVEADIITNGMNHAPDWLNPYYSAREYGLWSDFLENNQVLRTSDIVISDNYIQPLKYYPKALIMGSFVWHDVLNEPTEGHRALLEKEKALFRNIRPTVLCLKDFATPEIIEHASTVQLGLFTEKAVTVPKLAKGNVLITGGGTGRLNECLFNFAGTLNQGSQYNIYIDNALNSSFPDTYPVFDYTDESFKELSAIIARPGIGIISDAARFGIPLAMVPETGNKELMHNTMVMETLNAGFRLDPEKDVALAVKQLTQFLEVPDRTNYGKFTFDGHKGAAQYILNTLN